MSIKGITNINQYAAIQTVKAQVKKQSDSSTAVTAKAANAPKANTQANKPATYNDIDNRIANIPDLGRYGDLIQRFLSGESELETPGSMKPLTEDQIALRSLMREYRKTDTRTLAQVQESMHQANKNFFDYWMSSGNKGPMPAHVTSADGSFKILNSKAEKDEFMKNNTMNILENMMSVIKAEKSSSFNMKV